MNCITHNGNIILDSVILDGQITQNTIALEIANSFRLHKTQQLFVVVVQNNKVAIDLQLALSNYIDENSIKIFTALETLPYEQIEPIPLTVAQRTKILNQLETKDESLKVLIIPAGSFVQKIPKNLQLKPLTLELGKSNISWNELIKKLVDFGYKTVDMVETRGEFAIRGGIIDVFIPLYNHPIRLDFFGNELTSANFFYSSDQRSFNNSEKTVEIYPVNEIEKIKNLENSKSIIDFLPKSCTIFLVNKELIKANIENYQEINVELENSVKKTLKKELPESLFNYSEVLNIAKQRALKVQEFSFLEQNSNNNPKITPIFLSSLREFIKFYSQKHIFNKEKVVILAKGFGIAQRIVQYLNESDINAIFTKELNTPSTKIVQVSTGFGKGFFCSETNFRLITTTDLKLELVESLKLPQKVSKNTITPVNLNKGDFVVHEKYGIAQFDKLETRIIRNTKNQEKEFIVLKFAPQKPNLPNDILYMPADSVSSISKFVIGSNGAGQNEPTLSKLGSLSWENTKRKATVAAREISLELLQLYSQRMNTKGYAFSKDTVWQMELEESFEHTPTPDQLTVLDEIKQDMTKPIPMDRLLCGDVGYGKTEVAIRAAFKAVQDGKQVAILAPTTLLVRQHLQTFSNRIAAFPVKINALSRLTTPIEKQKILENLSNGAIDIIIGTHSLLSHKITFKDLGLLIVDEEQRFGVEQKETLKSFQHSVDVLSMSATPIPRTLEMAIAGVRDLSSLASPPEDRQPVLTFVGKKNIHQIVASIKREMIRGGQVFYLHNDISTIDLTARQLQELIPNASIGVAHAKMTKKQLEKTVENFWEGKYTVLVCTTIVENGIDIPNANTLIVDNAHMFGLSQMHQLRGRVGRSSTKAYAYFFYPENMVLSEIAYNRLAAINEFSNLGSGISISMRDLEIRGAGSLLGAKQSGHIAGVGFDMFVRLIEQAVKEFKKIMGVHALSKSNKENNVDAKSKLNSESKADAENKTDAKSKVKAMVQDDFAQNQVKQNIAKKLLGYSTNFGVQIDLPIQTLIPKNYITSQKLRLEIYNKISKATLEQDFININNELKDRFGKQIPKEIFSLFELSKLKELASSIGVQTVGTQGKYIKLYPFNIKFWENNKANFPNKTIVKPAIKTLLYPFDCQEYIENNQAKFNKNPKILITEVSKIFQNLINLL